ncbi:hypothetical protein GE09DRAFT_1212933 [Coniochaeta sp. 2T2.1]|nr:hypothetical protein GE09DRAFT_1212933 [Coniochaeta sp. 2T2.1]
MSGDRLPQFQQHPAGPDSPPRHTTSQDASYKIREQPLGSAKPVRVVIIGAGASGLNMIRTLRLSLTNYELVVYEKNADVGGTWFENRYPGCRCDIPSHNYQFSWRPNHEWSNFHAPAKEIGDYLCRVCDEEGMRDVIKTSHRVSSASWNEEKGIWHITVRNEETDEEFDDYATFLVDGTGILNHWKWPDVPGLQDFRGTLIHTANWPENFDHRGKVVAVIGNGSTGIQVVPEIQPGVTHLYHIVRTPTWVTPPRRQAMLMMGKGDILSDIEFDDKENFSAATIARFKSDPEFYRRFVKGMEREVNSNFPVILKDSPVQAFARAKVVEYMTAMLKGDPVLCKKLIPTFPLGCRRMTPAPGYLESLTQPNVSVITENMARIVPEGIELESGEVLKVDAIVCATGFDLSFCPRFPLVGRKGKNLQDTWRQEVPKAYMSCAVAGLPNYFSFLGPNGPIGHGSVFTLTEHIAKYIAGVIKKCQTEGIKAVAPSQVAVDDYFEHITAFMPRTAWGSPCRSWFKAGKEEGPVVALHPGSRIHFFHMLERFRGEDFEYVYDKARQNRFEYLGNGFSTKELDPGVDSTWYLDAPTAGSTL